MHMDVCCCQTITLVVWEFLILILIIKISRQGLLFLATSFFTFRVATFSFDIWLIILPTVDFPKFNAFPISLKTYSGMLPRFHSFARFWGVKSIWNFTLRNQNFYNYWVNTIHLMYFELIWRNVILPSGGINDTNYQQHLLVVTEFI